MRKPILTCLLGTLLFAPLCALAESNDVSDNLPIDVQVDLLGKELRRLIQVDDNQGIVDLIPKIRALEANIPDALYFLEANALYKTGNALAARDRLVVYLANTGREGRYYQQATGLMLQVQEQAEIQEKERREKERLRREEVARSAEKARALRIRQAQRQLFQVGFPTLEDTGQLDKQTRIALATFQVNNDLTINGDISDATLERLQGSVTDSHTCDDLAAYPRSASEWGIVLSDIAAQAAVPACNEALRDYPDVIRFQIQYGRALLASGRGGDALTAAKHAAGLGYPAAEVLLGKIYASGSLNAEGTPDDDEALRYFEMAAGRDYPEALVQIGNFHDLGRADFRRDAAAASRWYVKAAELGYPPAQVLVGDRHRAGKGLSRDSAEAFKWYSRAANLGYPAAEVRVGEAYEKGRGVKRNKESAISWYRLAKEHGSREALANLQRLGG